MSNGMDYNPTHRQPTGWHMKEIIMETTETAPKAPALKTIETHVERAQRGASARLLHPRDLIAARDAYREALRFAKKHGIDPKRVRVEADGGAVPNSYGHKAVTTGLTLANGRVIAGRTWARTVKGGDYGSLRIVMPALDERKGKDIPTLRLYKAPRTGRKYTGEWIFDL